MMHPAPGCAPPKPLARRLRAEAREVAIALPPEAGHDFNDVLLRGGPEAVRAVIESALPQADDDVTQQIGQHRPINYIAPDTALPLLRSDEGDLSRAVRAGLEPAARLQSHALAVPLRRHSDLGRAGR